MRFQITQDGPVDLATTNRPVIDAQHPRGILTRWSRSANQSQQGVSADRHSELARQPRAGFPAGRERCLPQCFGQPAGFARTRLGDLRQPLGERLAGAIGEIAKEPTQMEFKSNNTAM